jgi:RNA polymerase sigma-70 factor, ECF subfamily
MMKTRELIPIMLSRALSDDREGLFRHIWDTYRKRLYYYITAVMRAGREDGEDLLQEIMMKVYDHLDTYRAGRSLDGWLYAIARNHCVDFLRKKGSRPCGEEMREEQCKDEDPCEALCAGELNRTIEECLERLGAVDREMVYLRHFERLTYRTIGNVIGMNVNSVKTRMRAVETRLRRELKEWL